MIEQFRSLLVGITLAVLAFLKPIDGELTWIGKNKLIGTPFENCHRREFNTHMNYNASYTDIMLYTDVA